MSLEVAILALAAELKRFNDRADSQKIIDGVAVTPTDKPAKPAKPAAKAAPAVIDQPIETAEAQATEPKVAAPATPVVETPAAKAATQDDVKAATQDDVKAAVIALVNEGNHAAGNQMTGREYAAAVLQPFGAKNVSTVKPEDYAKVLEALKAKLEAVKAEAEIAG